MRDGIRAHLSTPQSSQPWLPESTSSNSTELRTTISQLRRRTRSFLSSKLSHYLVLSLVSLDVSSIFCEFVIKILACDGTILDKEADDGIEALGIISLVFSCLFMLELLASIWAFGPTFFRSKFHCFDAIVVLVAFVIDVVLHGVLEEVASLVIVLRLWRVFKIIEELSLGAEEQMEGLQEKAEALERENQKMEVELRGLRARVDALV